MKTGQKMVRGKYPERVGFAIPEAGHLVEVHAQRNLKTGKMDVSGSFAEISGDGVTPTGNLLTFLIVAQEDFLVPKQWIDAALSKSGMEVI